MPSVQIKNVPDDVHRIYRHRAVESGQSLQEYLLAKLVEDAAVPTRDEFFKRLESRSGGQVSFEDAVDAIRTDRDSR